ncbi:MAG: DUF429 domain-containing protein [Rubrivivax sp.]|nr:DUF429 domain-containing protein [Rubrivivax sp.]
MDFTCAPAARKPSVVALGSCTGAVLRLQQLLLLPRMADFDALLHRLGPWLGAFDFPFGLPRAFVQAQQLGDTAAGVIAEVHRRCATRMDFRALIDSFGNTQPAGQRLLHRATDVAMLGVRSTSPLQTRYVPVGFMYYEGFSRLVKAGVHLPALVDGDAQRVAIEGYPGLLAHQLIARRSYKNDNSAERLMARKDIVEALEQGRTPLGLRLKLSPAQAGELVADAQGDKLDAVLCLMQAAWAQTQPRLAQPATVDAVEGWITGAGSAADLRWVDACSMPPRRLIRI